MLKHVISVVFLLVILGAEASAQDACSRPPLTPNQRAALSEEDRVREFQLRLECLRKAIADAKGQLNDLSILKVGEFAKSWASTRDAYFADLETKDAQIVELNGRIEKLEKELTGERNQCEQETKALKATIEERDKEIMLLKEDVVRLNGVVDFQAEALTKCRADFTSASTEIDTLREQVRKLEKERDQLAQDLAKCEDEKKALEGQLDRLAKERSEFFAALKEVLGERESIKVVGDRFIIESDVLFPVGSASLSDAGKEQIEGVAVAVRDLPTKIQSSIKWVLQVNGHSDIQPIRGGGRYADNWELSIARALAVVGLLQKKGVPPDHLAAAGFGEYQPLQRGTTQDVYARNRRIELKLTDYGPQEAVQGESVPTSP